MSLKLNRDGLAHFCDAALLSNLTYHRSRSILWERFAKLLKDGKTENKDAAFSLDFAMFNSIKSALTSRSESFTDEKKLALETALQDILSQLAEEDEDEDDEKEELPPPRPKRAAAKAEEPKVEQEHH